MKIQNLLMAALLPALAGAAVVDLPKNESPFEVLPSTRRITTLLGHGNIVLAGTTGGLVEWDTLTGEKQVLLPGVPIRALARVPGHSDVVMVASDTGTYKLRAGRLLDFDAEPTQGLLVEGGRIFTGHPAGKVRFRRGGKLAEWTVPTVSPVHSIVRHGRDLLFASVEGVWRRVLGRFVAEGLPGGALSRNITRLVQVDGRLLAGTPVGVFERHGPGRWQRVHTGEQVFVTDLVDSYEGLLVGTAGDGLLRLGDGEPERIDPDLQESWLQDPEAIQPPDLSHATALLEHGGRILVGTLDNGLWILEDGTSRAWQIDDEPPGNTITSLAHADAFGTLVVGTFEQGVGMQRKGNWRHFKKGQAHLLSSWVNHVASDGRRVIVRFSNGQVYTQIGSHRFRQLGGGDGWPKNWTSSAGSSDGRQWVGTQNAFYLRDSDGWSVFAPKPVLQGKLVMDVALDGDIAWLATHRSGVFRWDAQKDSWTNYTLGSGMPDTWVTAIEEHNGEVWAATFNGGLARLPAGRTAPEDWKVYRENDPVKTIPSDGVNCLLSTDNGLWIGTFSGLVWTDGTTWKTYGLESGLPSKSILSLTVGDGVLWVGTDAGLVRANLKDLR